ncbi:MAG TPA: hypothetical protein VM888_09980, partial [Chitinophagaceae bacterium]|nr:hypothetical protein [Chitinophagaceae bacterium]
MSTARKKRESENTGRFLSQLFFKYIPYWPLFLILTAICLGYSWYKLQHETPLYSANIKILVKDQARESKIAEELSAGTPKNDVENQIEVLKSLPLMTNVVKNLSLYAPMFEEGKFIPHTAYQISPISVVAMNPDSLMEQPKVPFEFDAKSQQVTIDNNKFGLNNWVNTKYGNIKFVKNPFYDGTDYTDSELFFS